MKKFIIKNGQWLYITTLLAFLMIFHYIETPIDSAAPVLFKYISVPLLVIVIFFVKRLILKSSSIISWSGLFLVVIFFISGFLASYPLILITNALLSSVEVVKISGVVDRKYMTTRGKYGSPNQYNISVKNEEDKTQVELNISKKEYNNILLRDVYNRLFYEGGLNIPWYWKGYPPSKQTLDAL